MARRQTLRLSPDARGLEVASAILRAGGLVAFPTETVYGLGAHALDPAAVRGIFEAKQRPADDPLIVHLPSVAAVRQVAIPTSSSKTLAEHFWPGPLTLVQPRRPEVPRDVTAGLETVGVRVPRHTVALELLRMARLPLAAPSANLFGRPSPTTAAHVLEDLDGCIDAIVDGGPTPVGVESTIVDVSVDPPRLLRPGGVALEDIERVLGRQLEIVSHTRQAGPQLSPGLLESHYAPRTPLALIRGPRARERLIAEVNASVARGQRVGVLAVDEDAAHLSPAASIEVLGRWNCTEALARRLFQALRTLDSQNLEVLFARELGDSSVGLGRALADRLRRASRRVIDTRE